MVYLVLVCDMASLSHRKHCGAVPDWGGAGDTSPGDFRSRLRESLPTSVSYGTGEGRISSILTPPASYSCWLLPSGVQGSPFWKVLPTQLQTALLQGEIRGSKLSSPNHTLNYHYNFLGFLSLILQ